jgi:DNA helicase-2/ATP-dependent DNA helicase PcrA
MAHHTRGGLTVTHQQAAVVDRVAARRVTVAGAGSGSTHTTVATVIGIVGQGGAALDQFVLITCTNKAADELRAQLEREVGRQVAAAADVATRLHWRDQQGRISAAYVGTIHGFCARILRTFGYSEPPQDAAEAAIAGGGRRPLSAPLGIREHELRRMAREMLSHTRSRGLDLAGILDRAMQQLDDRGKPYRVSMAELIADANERYAAWKEEDQALSADDLLRRTANLLAGPAGAQVAERIGERYRYVFIDELQDTDQAQKKIINRLRGVLAVGDRYGFRAADVHRVKQIADEHQVDARPLSISRRPTDELLRAQNVLFTSMAQPFPELGEPLDPWEGTAPHGGALPPLTCIIVPKESHDLRYNAVADWIRTALRRQIRDPRSGEPRNVEPGDITILVCANSHLRACEPQPGASLGPDGVSIRSDAGGQFYQRPEIVGTYRMLRLVLHYSGDPMLSMASRSPHLAHLDPREPEQLMLQYGTHEGAPLTDWLRGRHPEVDAHLAALRRAAQTDAVPQILEKLYRLFAIRDHYAARRNQQAVENLEKLRELARCVLSDEQTLTLRQFVDRLLLAHLTEQEEPEAGLPRQEDGACPSHIRIMTVHRAPCKGPRIPDRHRPRVAAPSRQPPARAGLHYSPGAWPRCPAAKRGRRVRHALAALLRNHARADARPGGRGNAHLLRRGYALRRLPRCSAPAACGRSTSTASITRGRTRRCACAALWNRRAGCSRCSPANTSFRPHL